MFLSQCRNGDPLRKKEKENKGKDFNAWIAVLRSTQQCSVVTPLPHLFGNSIAGEAPK